MTVKTWHRDTRYISGDDGINRVFVTEAEDNRLQYLHINSQITAAALIDLLPALVHYAEHGRLPEPSEGAV